ncbi:MAG: type VI secretion system membrane subunit TssM [Gammaproteobacteria bacterium]|nr:type VI secretion system membrane subunit TssM [Gammaproteobacteria bacterium]
MFRRLFRRFFAFLMQRWVLALLVIIVLALLIWFVGPLIAVADYKPLVSQVVRLLIIVAMLIIWGLTNLRLRTVETKTNKALAEKIERNVDDRETPHSPKSAAITADESILGERLKEALRSLQNAKLGRGRKLYQLPWYVIIGAPGSGKTTTLKNSGLRFPLQSQLGDEPVKGAGGTRYCDWWFTNEAVLIDTAGRYTTQDNPQKIENRAWLGFLNLLKKTRPKRPLNGIIIAVSILDVLRKTPTQQALQTSAIKRRIQELNEQLSMNLPVYVIFTKLDTIAGFAAFFADLEPQQREQVWGMTFPINISKSGKAGNTLAQFDAEYQALISRANDRVTNRLHNERDPQRRTLAYEFPRQMLGLQNQVHAFLQNIFSPNQFELTALLRGVFFLSGTQTNAPAQWVTGVLPVDRCTPPVTTYSVDPKSFFIKNLFSNLIFAEANMASANTRAERRFRWVYAAFVIAVVCSFVGTLVFWKISEQRNLAHIDRIYADITRYREQTHGGVKSAVDWLTLANGLDVLKAMPTGYDQGDKRPMMLMGFGLYQGDKIGAQARLTYLKILERFFLPAVSEQLLQQMRDARNDQDALYQALKFYLMLHQPEKMDAKLFGAWADALWQRQLPGEPYAPLRESLNMHLQVAIAQQLPPPAIDQRQVDAAREILNKAPLEQRLYRNLKNQLLRDHSQQFVVADVLAGKADTLFFRRSGAPLTQGIPWLFTYEGFHTGFNLQTKQLGKRLADEQWIYGDYAAKLSADQTNELIALVERQYFSEYIDRWKALLNDLAVNSFNNANRGGAVLRTLSSSSTPLLTFLKSVRRHTALSELPGVSDQTKQVAATLATQATPNRLTQFVPLGNDVKVRLPGQVVSDEFQTLNDFVNKDGDGTPIRQLQQSLVALNGYFQNLTQTGDIQRAAYDANTSAAQGTDPVYMVSRAVADSPSPVREWFQSVSVDSSRVTATATQGHLNSVWSSEVVSFFDQAIKGRYPIDPASAVDVKLDDFTAFFGPGGILDRYFTTNIKPFADTDREQWRWRKPVGLSDSALKLFERARRIQRAYFGSKPGAPQVGFKLVPYSLDRAASRVLLQVGDQSVAYEHGPLHTSTVVWPTPDNDSAKVVFTLANKGTPISAQTQGQWSWFRLLNKYATRERGTQNDDFLLTFTVQGVEARFELSPQSTYNPFANNDVQHFTVPRRL